MNMIKKLPKIELHVHFDGSLDTNKVKEKYSLSYNEIKNKMIVDNNCKSLNDYLKKFEYPISILQTKEEISDSIISFLEKLKEDNVIYVEFRFAPQLHTRKGLTIEEVVKIALKAKEKVNIKSNIILCMMRGNNNEKENIETIEIAKKYLNKGVCAVDLAGAEALYKTEDYRKLFEKAKEEGINFTIHAGEADGVESIKSAISFGAKRIGHGVRAIENKELIKEIIKKDIVLEVCVKSNIDTYICNNYKTHPLENLYLSGVKTTINTDNMTVSNINLTKEYENIINETNLKVDDIIKMNINAINAAFITKEEKKELIEKLKNN